MVRVSKFALDNLRRLWLEDKGQAQIPCPPETTLRSRGYVPSPVSFVTITKNALGIQGDIPFQLPIPAKAIIVVSRTNLHLNDGLYMSFRPLGLSNPNASAILPLGTENWLPLCNPESALSTIGLGYIFDEPLPPTTMYMTIDQAAGGTPPFYVTLAVSNTLKWWNMVGTPI
jgi:hypothetical protein